MSRGIQGDSKGTHNAPGPISGEIGLDGLSQVDRTPDIDGIDLLEVVQGTSLERRAVKQSRAVDEDVDLELASLFCRGEEAGSLFLAGRDDGLDTFGRGQVCPAGEDDDIVLGRQFGRESCG